MAKRINKSFLLTLSGVIGVALLAMVLAPRLINQGDASELAIKAESAVKAGDLKLAKELYGRALRREPNNVQINVAMGDVVSVLARDDRDEIGKDVIWWKEALQKDPRHVPALQRLMDAHRSYAMTVRQEPESFNGLAESARALLQADPSNDRARAWEHIAVLGAWLYGGAADDEKIEATIEGLKALMPKVPDMADAPAFVADAYLRQARQREAANDLDGAAAFRQKAHAVYETALAAAPEDAQLLHRHGRFLLLSLPARADQTQRDEATARSRQIARQAADLVKPDSTDYAEIRLRLAEVLMQDGKSPEAEKVVADLLKVHPYSQRARMAMSTLIKSSRLEEAIGLLEQPQGDDPTHVGFRALLRRELELQRLVELTYLRLDAWRAAARDPEKQKSLHLKIDEGFSQASTIVSPDAPLLLKLKAKILLLNERDVTARREAIRLMQKAYERYQQQRMLDPDLTYTLAQTYRSLNEPGQAREYLMRVVEARPGAVGARKELAQLLISMQDFNRAKVHVDELAKLAPDDPEVRRFQLAVAKLTGDDTRALEMARSMPQQTDRENLSKAAALLAAGEGDEAIKLIEPLSAAERARELTEGSQALTFTATRMLAEHHLRAGRRNDAKPLIDAVLARLPNDTTWRRLQLIAEDRATPEELRQLREMQIGAINDPIERSLHQYNSLIEQNKLDEAIAVLKETEKSAGDPPQGRLLEAIFNYAVGTRNWQMAEEYADKLGRVDVDQAQGLYYRARISFERRDIDLALRQAKDLTVRIPEFARHWLLLGQVQSAAGQFDGAIASYNTVLEKQPDNIQAVQGMVEAQLMTRQIPAAQRYIEQGLRMSGGAPFFKEVKRRVEEQFGDPTKMTEEREREYAANANSLVHWTTLVENYFRSADALISRSDSQGAAGFHAKARARIDEAMAKWPDELGVYRRLSDWSFRTGKAAEVLPTLEQIRSRESFKDKTDPLLVLAEHYRRMGGDNLAKAEAAFTQAIELAKDESQKTPLRQKLAQFHIQNKNHDRAVALLTSVYESNKDPGVQRQLVDTLLAADKSPEAARLIDEALSRTPDDAKLLCQKALVRIRAGDITGAEPIAEHAIRSDPQYGPGYYYRGVILLTKGDVNAAIPEMEKARDLAPSSVEMRLGLADAYLKRKQPDASIKELEVALQLAPSRGDLRLRVLEQYFAQRRWSDVEAIIQTAKADNELGKDPVWWQRERQMWVERGNHPAALAAITRAVELNPMDSQILCDYLDTLLMLKRYQEVVTRTEPLLMVVAEQRPWWVHTLRAEALQHLNDKAGVEREFGRAMTAADTLKDDAGAASICELMSKALGVKPTVDAVRPRKDPRWFMGLLPVLLGYRETDLAVEIADELVGPVFEQLSADQTPVALKMASLAYHTAALAGKPGAVEKAELAYNRFLTLTAGNSAAQIEALNNLAGLIAEHPTQPNPARALTFARNAYDLMKQSNMDDSNVVDTLGWVLVLSGKVDEGIEHLLRSAASEQAPPEAFYHLGEAYLKTNKALEAAGHLDRAKLMLANLKSRGASVDPTLASKIDTAIERARQAVKSAAAGN